MKNEALPASWYKVTIEPSDSPETRNKTALELEEQFRSRFGNAMQNHRAGAVIAHEIDEQEKPPHHFYYFSPEAMAFMDDVVRMYRNERCFDPTSRENVRYVHGDRGKYRFASEVGV